MNTLPPNAGPTARVALVSMPWGPVTDPPLGLSILRSCLSEVHIQTRVFHFNLLLLRHLWYSTYREIADIYALNDFVFSGILDNTQMTKRRFEDLREEIAKVGLENPEQTMKKVLKIRESVVPNYLNECVRTLMSESPSFIGFTCSYDQTMASLALAKLIRRNMPDVLIGLGGYAVAGETGEMLLETFPFVDCVAQGDSESTIVDLAEASVGNRSLSQVRGIKYVATAGAVHTTPNVRGSLDSIPLPEFDDFFQDKADLEGSDGIRIKTNFLPVETSRGCWWGQKHHCVFCGIDDYTMKYRSRKPENVVEMLDTLHERYGIPFFRLNDYILPHTYHKTLVPNLIRRPRPYFLACEAKANLTRDQLKNLALAGFKEVQAGVESFSSHVLELMKKGVKASQNILLLIWGKQYGITIHFNILYGIPGECIDDYKEMVRLIPTLYHLNPPSAVTITIFTRFSPLQEGKVLGSTGTTIPARRYRIVLSEEFVNKTGFEMSKYCYQFESPNEPPEELQYWYRVLDTQCQHWKTLHETREVDLWFETRDQGVVFFDSRWSSAGEYITGDRELGRLYRFLTEKPILSKRWKSEIEGHFCCPKASWKALEFLVEKRLVVEVDGKLIALARESKPSPLIFGSESPSPVASSHVKLP